LGEAGERVDNDESTKRHIRLPLSRESRRAVVFIEVDDLDAVIASLQGSNVAAPRRQTFYGSDEITYEEPGGNLVTFAKFAK